MIETAMKCPCGEHAVVDLTAVPYTADERWECHCTSCYDGAPDSGAIFRLIGRGKTPEEAIATWWERVELEWEIDYVPSALFADLANQADFESERQRGWETRDSWLMPGKDKWHGPKLMGSL